LIQVFLNLVSNAEHAIREVRETGRIQIRLGRIGTHISVTVQDDGVGLTQEALPKLFDPFYTTKRPGGGTGLGLSICMSIVREHGGSIDVETLPAGGSAFTVYLPAAPDEISGAPLDTGTSSRQSAPAPDILKGRSILVVDDEESIRMLLDEGLSAHGMRVDCAANSAEALDFIRRRAYDVALCDVNLSPGAQGTSGRETAQQIAAVTREGVRPEIIFMTGDLVEDNGSDGHIRQLQKPFRISDVLAVVREVLAPKPAEKLR
jgi:CheY-like chemotaxis protein